jgi:hypothetical protein
MKTLSSLVAIVALGLTIVFLPIIGGALFAMVFFGLFVLALVGVLGGVEDHTVRQKDVPIDPTGWRDGGSGSAG